MATDAAASRSSAQILIPRLETERLMLREPRASDFAAYAEHCADPVAMKYMTGASDQRTSWRFLAAMSGTWVLNGSGWWAIDLRETGELVGVIGNFFRETQLGPDPILEVGWSLFRQSWRKGYATEAARAAIAWGFERHQVRRTIAYVNPENVASVGVCKKAGMTFDGEASFYGEPSARYAIERG
jgi:RimJ/RimL family protein N-acetyltransferase